jgi:hypothetical protein
LNRWKKNFCQLLNVHGIIDVRQTEKHRWSLKGSDDGAL